LIILLSHLNAKMRRIEMRNLSTTKVVSQDSK
jgi:ribosomal protein L35